MCVPNWLVISWLMIPSGQGSSVLGGHFKAELGEHLIKVATMGLHSGPCEMDGAENQFKIIFLKEK